MKDNRIGYRQKIVSAATEVVGKNLISAVVSTEDKDRDGDIIRQSGWDLEHFQKHPILLSSHNYGALTNVIGEWAEMAVKGKELRGVAEYYVGEGNAEADWGFNLASKGMAAYSVGFIPDFDKAKELKDDKDGWLPNYEFKGQELLEVSHVTVPSNRQSLQQAKAMAQDPVITGLIDQLLAESPPDEEDDLDKMLTAVLAKTGAQYKQFVEDIDSRIRAIEARIDTFDVKLSPLYNPELTRQTIRTALKEAIRNGD